MGSCISIIFKKERTPNSVRPQKQPIDGSDRTENGLIGVDPSTDAFGGTLSVAHSHQGSNVNKNTEPNDDKTHNLDAFLSSEKSYSLTMPQISPEMPPRPEFLPFTVPYLCKTSSYDKKGFWTYPERRGWIVHSKDTNCHVLCPPGTCWGGKSSVLENRRAEEQSIFSRADGTPVLASDKVIFLQGWLFFGLLTEVSTLCGLELDVEAEFIVNGGLASTAKLNGLAGRWFEAAIKAGHAGDKKFMERILALTRHTVLMTAEELVESNSGFERRFKYPLSECRVLHSLDICARVTALHLLLHVYIPGFTATDKEGWTRKRILNSLDWANRHVEGMDQLSDLARTDLEKRGWCESELDLLAPDELAFASLLPRPNTRDHSNCGDTVRNAYQTDEKTYLTRHVEDGCSCHFVKVQNDALVDILSKGEVPKFIITEQLELQLVPNRDYPYVAISHVWADGLGNPFTNSLPRCQLQRLRGFAHKLYSVSNLGSTPAVETPVGLWMDTLCIPVDPAAKVFRKKAIQLLGKTFNEANAVLILDRELDDVEPTNASFLEMGLRILCSGWVKRLWTLQEATLASEALGEDKLYFQMGGGPFLYQKYDRNRRAIRSADAHTTELQAEERTLLYDNGVMLELGAQIPSVYAMRNMRKGWSPFFVIHSALEHRSTSKAEDVPICIASLLGKDISTILSTENVEQRMANFYVLMHEVPYGVIWYEGPEKLSIKPFRWAPSPINACPRTHTFMGWNNGLCDPAGLHVKYGGFIFAESERNGRGLEERLPRTFTVVSAETGGVLGKFSRPRHRKHWQVSLQQGLAIIVRQDDHPGMLPNAAVVSLEDAFEVNNDGGTQLNEIACSIIGYTDMIFPDNNMGQEDVFKVHVKPADQMWCLT